MPYAYAIRVPTNGRSGADADRQTDRRTDGQTDRRTDGQTDRRTDGQTDRRTDGQTDGWKGIDLDMMMIDAQGPTLEEGRTVMKRVGADT